MYCALVVSVGEGRGKDLPSPIVDHGLFSGRSWPGVRMDRWARIRTTRRSEHYHLTGKTDGPVPGLNPLFLPIGLAVTVVTRFIYSIDCYESFLFSSVGRLKTSPPISKTKTTPLLRNRYGIVFENDKYLYK